MNIVILGKGNMGTPLARLIAAVGHEVQSFGSRDDSRPALAEAEIVVLAMKYEQSIAFTEQAGIAALLEGRIVIDITNPLAADFMSLTLGYDTSAAEEIAARLPGARPVKAFNTLFAAVLAEHAEGRITPVPVMVAGDDSDAVDAVVALAEALRFRVVRSGKLANARYLEPMTEMMIQLGFGLGHGDRIGFVLHPVD